MPETKFSFFGLIFLLVLEFLFPASLFADGIIIPPPYYQVQETAQKAVIWHDGNTETLILSITFRGDAEDFGWVVPVPSKPEVSKASDEIFTALEELTIPKVQRYPTPFGFGGYKLAPEVSTVQVIETKRVDIYEVTVLRSGTSKDLSDWLSKNNYPYPKNAAYILDDYIANNWYFVAAKVSTEALGYKTTQQLRDGHATPLKIVFKSEKIIYPLKISSVISDYSGYPVFPPSPTTPEIPPPKKIEPFEASPSSGEVAPQESKISPETEWQHPPKYTIPLPEEYVNIVLYVFANRKKTVPGFNIDYASSIKPETIANLAFDEKGSPWVKPTKKMFLTKLARSMKTSEMTTDLILRDAEDNKPVNAPGAIDISGFRFWLVILVPLLLEIAIIWYLIAQRKIKLW